MSARSWFTMIPNIVVEGGNLSHAGFRLYVWYKKVCGEKNGTCYQTIDTICEGCGMSRPTAIKARKELVTVGLVKIVKKASEDGTVKIIVRIVDVWQENSKAFLLKKGSRVKDSNFGRVNDIYSNKNPLEEEPKNTLSEQKSFDGRRGKRQPSPFDAKAAAKLHKVVSSHIKVNCRSDNKQWAYQFRLMREVDKVPAADIRKAIEWYGKNIGKEYIPEAYSAAAFREKYNNGKIPGAMKRSSNGDGDNSVATDLDSAEGITDLPDADYWNHKKLSDRLIEMNAWTDWPKPPAREVIDREAKALGINPKRIRERLLLS